MAAIPLDNPIPSVASVPQTFDATHMQVVTLNIDNSALLLTPPGKRKASGTIALFTINPDGSKTYAAQQLSFQTNDLDAAEVNVPSIATATTTDDQSLKDVFVWLMARQADLVTATAALASATAARNAAWTATKNAQDPTFIAATAAFNTAQQNLATAQAAAKDPANPPLVSK